ncbi:hypothetical protein TWF506_005354 [Arthrobotrys conoides]|uniref:Uncharacterized protein n=1 Tax=Arthrobotrys conoides TaxID=74498 RepID=A0AAN8NBN9_9PEZI
MKKQKKGEPVKATFERFHKWAADVNVIVKGKTYKRPRLGTGLPRDPHPPKQARTVLKGLRFSRYHLKAVKGKRRRIFMQDDDTITGEFPPEDKKWYDVLAEDSDDSDYFKEPWYVGIDKHSDYYDPLRKHKLHVYPQQEEEDEEFMYICLIIQDALKQGYPVLPIFEKYIQEGFRYRNRPTYWQWAMKNKIKIYAHILWFSLYITPIIWYWLFYPPKNMVATKHGLVWPAEPVAAPPANGLCDHVTSRFQHRPCKRGNGTYCSFITQELSADDRCEGCLEDIQEVIERPIRPIRRDYRPPPNTDKDGGFSERQPHIRAEQEFQRLEKEWFRRHEIDSMLEEAHYMAHYMDQTVVELKGSRIRRILRANNRHSRNSEDVHESDSFQWVPKKWWKNIWKWKTRPSMFIDGERAMWMLS